MPMQCCASGCKNRARRGGGRQFFRFPSARSDRKRRKKWILATQREGWEPTVNSRICGDHFISGKPSERCNDPDYIPTIFNIEENDPEQSSLFVFFDQFSGNGDELSYSNNGRTNHQTKNETDDDTVATNHIPVVKSPSSLNFEKARSSSVETTSPYFSSAKMKDSLRGIISRFNRRSVDASMDQQKPSLHVTS